MITALIVIPLLGALFVSASRPRQARGIALGFNLLTAIVAFVLWRNFDAAAAGLQLLERQVWIPAIGAEYVVGVDGLSLLLVILTSIVVPFALLAQPAGRGFCGLMLITQAALYGTFTAQNFVLWFLFYEMSLIPSFLLIKMWGGENRDSAATKFFVYTFLGSVAMLLSFLAIYLARGTFDFQELAALGKGGILSGKIVWLAFAGIFLGLAVKVPLFPFHTWQPDTYTTAPNTGSMLLAGIMLKMGIYGILRWLIPVTTDVLYIHGTIAMILGIIGLLYGSIIAIMQQEVKRLIAYSSLAHVGLMTAAAFTLNTDATRGVVIQMLSHGLVVVGLFFVADVMVRRTGTLRISSLGGIAKVAPRFAIFFMIVMLAAVALPLTSGFPGEFLMLIGLYQYNVWMASFGGISIILGAVYMFRLYQHSMYGEAGQLTQKFEDLRGTELLVAIVLILMILILGIYPKVILGLF
jgi:NADH-quinone oxidoreductase subunit M